jgi:hypothetical protein
MADGAVIRKGGRPTLAPSERKVIVPMRLEAVLFDEVCRRAKADAVSVAEALRRIIRRALSTK